MSEIRLTTCVITQISAVSRKEHAPAKKLPVHYSLAIFSLLHLIIHADYEARERQIYDIDFFSSISAMLIVNGRWLPVVSGCLDRDSSSEFYI